MRILAGGNYDDWAGLELPSRDDAGIWFRVAGVLFTWNGYSVDCVHGRWGFGTKERDDWATRAEGAHVLR